MAQHLLSILSRTEVWVGTLALAAFLILTWALRGAPIGQAPRGELDEEEGEGPGASYRDRVVVAMVGGLLLVLAGAYVAASRGVAWSLPVFALGFGIVLTLVAFNRRYRHTSPALRRAVELSDAALTAALLGGVLIVANVLAFRYGGRPLDLTRERTFSLSSQTRNVLADLRRDVTFTVFFGAGPQARPQFERVQQLLELYKAANPRRVRVEYVNPFRDLEKFDALKKRAPDVALTEGGGVVVEYGEGDSAERAVVHNNDLFEFQRPGGNIDRFVSTFKGEGAVTTALIRLREGKRLKLAITTGHGEPSATEADPRKQGLGAWATRLAATGFDIVPISLIRDEIPDDVALVAVVGPRAPFKPEEVAKLKGYADAGGPVLMVIGGREPNGLEGMLAAYNLALGPGIVVDPLLNYRQRPNLVFAPVIGQVRHPIVDPLVNRPVFVPDASPIEIARAGPGRPVDPKLVPTAILQTSRDSWAETDRESRRIQRDKDDRPGPIDVGAAVAERPERGSGQPGRPRLVVFSSPNMADNIFVTVEPTNLDALTNAIYWLRGRSELGGIAPKPHVALTLVADPLLRARLILVPTVMAILLIIGLGVVTYAARRE